MLHNRWLLAVLTIAGVLFLTLGFVDNAYAGNHAGFSKGIGFIANIAEQGGLSQDTDLQNPIMKVIRFLLSLVAVLALGALVWGSIMYILSLGNDQRAETAKKIILYAIIGVLIAGASFLIIAVLQTIIAP